MLKLPSGRTLPADRIDVIDPVCSMSPMVVLAKSRPVEARTIPAIREVRVGTTRSHV
jgi:hypothetical protein